MINAHLSSGRITSTSQDAFSLYESARFGEKIQGKIEYSFVEALYLLKKGKMQIFSKTKPLTEDSLIKTSKKQDKRIETKYLAFADLRSKGYIVKTALKFGAEFRVYEKGIKPGEDHAKWLLFTSRESETMRWHEFSAKNRVAHATKKNLLLAIIDEEGSLTYYEVAWKKP